MANVECTYYPDLFRPYPPGIRDLTKKGQRGPADDIDDFNKGRIGFYNAVRFLLINRFAFNEPIPPAPTIPPANDALPDVLTGVSEAGRVYFVSVAGILISQGFTDPILGKPLSALGPEDRVFESDVLYDRRVKAFKADPANKGKEVPPRDSLDVGRAFVEQTVSAVKEFQSDDAMFSEVYEALKKEGTVTVTDAAGTKITFTVLARQVAEVSEQLVDQGADPHDPQLTHMIGDALSAILGKTLQGRFSATDIDLPDLEEGSQADVTADNVRALSAVYFSAMLEDLKFFAVADKVVEQFVSGMVPVSRGTAGDAMYDYFKAAPDRLTEVERRGLYARAFGL